MSIGSIVGKIIGVAITGALIYFGAQLPVDTVQNSDHEKMFFKEIIDDDGITRKEFYNSKNDGLSNTITKLQMAIEAKTDELKGILSEIKCNKINNANFLLRTNECLERAFEDEEVINMLIKDIKSQFNLEKKIATAHVFFKHVVKLILILSGIIGLFWIAVWTAREQREIREMDEQEKIRKWELYKTG